MHITITSDANNIYVTTNDCSCEFGDVKQLFLPKKSVLMMQIVEVPGVDSMTKIIYLNGSSNIIHFGLIYSINGDTDISSNQILYNKLIALIQ